MLKSYWDDLPSRSLLGWRLPLQRHGGFMTDSGFQNVRSHFDKAFRDTMSCWDNKEMDDFTSYRKLRDRQLTGKDRPSSLIEEGNNYKVVMDVQGFIDNDLKVTFLNDKELIVEGLIEKKSEGSFTRQSFKRRFSFPGNVVVNSAFSTLSSDNILTITVPKQKQQIAQEESKTSTQGMQSSISQKPETPLDTMESPLLSSSIESKLESLMEFPITKRNDFFADSYFDNVRSMYKTRVSEIMNKKAMRDSFDDFSSFRSLKEKDEQNIAVTVSGDNKEHKIVLDVQGYNEGDLKVRAVSDQELLVEGRVEKKTENSYCNNSFKRSFCLPNNANILEASSNLSSDGVLTIVVPKKEERPLPISYNIPITIEQKRQQSVDKLSEEKSSPLVIPLGYRDTSDTQCIIPVQIEGNVSPTSKNQYLASSRETHEDKSDKEVITESIKSDHDSSRDVTTLNEDLTSVRECMIPVLLASSQTSDQTQSSNTEHIHRSADESKSETSIKDILMREPAGANISKDVSSTKTSIINEHSYRTELPSDIQPTHIFTPGIVPIHKRGDFYNDNVFDAARQKVEHAVKNALNRSLSQEGNKMHFQNVEKEATEVSDTTGTSTVLDEIHSYKIVLDVYGFLEKDISVKTVSKNELSIEGIMEQQNGNSVTKHSFLRTFHLPDNIIIEESSSALSSDGMLTISVPKRVPTDQEILSSVSKKLTSESIETQLSNLTKQMDRISNITDVAIQPEPIKEKIVPLHIDTSSTGTDIRAETEETKDVSSIQSILKNIQLEKDLSSKMDNKSFQKESLAKELNVKSCFDLPVMKKGNFFQDSFFDDSRDTFESALRNAMSRFRSFSSFSDDLDFYKNLREEKFGSENLATAVRDAQQFKEVVVDVKGYPQDRITVKVIEGNGILVEGKIEEKMDAGFSTKSFRRTIFLSPEYNLKDATSALSIDGILNIKVPRSAGQEFLTN